MELFYTPLVLWAQETAIDYCLVTRAEESERRAGEREREREKE